jgi:hypothetical protein
MTYKVGENVVRLIRLEKENASKPERRRGMMNESKQEMRSRYSPSLMTLLVTPRITWILKFLGQLAREHEKPNRQPANSKYSSGERNFKN